MYYFCPENNSSMSKLFNAVSLVMLAMVVNNYIHVDAPMGWPRLRIKFMT